MKLAQCLSLGIGRIPVEALKAKYGNEASRFADIEGVTCHYRDEGTGPVLLMIHGVCASLHTWDAWVEELKPYFRIIRFDIPGFGFSGPSKKKFYTRDVCVDMVEKFVNWIGIDHFHIAGNSIGGFAAWGYALKYPHKVDKLVLVDPVGYNQNIPWVMHLAANPFIRPITRRMMPRIFFNIVIKRLFGDPSKLTPEIKNRYFELAMHNGNKSAMVDFFTVMRQLCRSEELPMGISDIKTSTLVLWGTKDRNVPFHHLNLWKRDLQHGVFKAYEGVGHTPMEEIPKQSAMDVRRFLQAG